MTETYPRIYRFALRLTKNEETARDLCQDTYIRAYRSLAERSQTGDPMPWFFKIAYNCFLDHLRLQSRRPNAVSYDSSPIDYCDREFVDPTEGPDQLLLKSQISPQILSAMKSLPKSQQELIRLSVIESLSYEEIAELHSCSVPAIRSRVHRAVDAIRRKIARDPKFRSVNPDRPVFDNLAA